MVRIRRQQLTPCCKFWLSWPTPVAHLHIEFNLSGAETPEDAEAIQGLFTLPLSNREPLGKSDVVAVQGQFAMRNSKHHRPNSQWPWLSPAQSRELTQWISTPREFGLSSNSHSPVTLIRSVMYLLRIVRVLVFEKVVLSQVGNLCIGKAFGRPEWAFSHKLFLIIIHLARKVHMITVSLS